MFREGVCQEKIMKKDEQHAGPDKQVAAVCGLYCEACTLFIATEEDPARLKELAARFQVSEDAVRCRGCRSTERGPYCSKCKMISCSAERGIDFCIECAEYPCDDLKRFQSERPHRIELFDDLKQIGAMGYEHWLKTSRENYSCPRCRCINSAYDSKCRRCGNEPSCRYVAKHREAIDQFFKRLGA
jgi:hypothetical protein